MVCHSRPSVVRYNFRAVPSIRFAAGVFLIDDFHRRLPAHSEHSGTGTGLRVFCHPIVTKNSRDGIHRQLYFCRKSVRELFA